MKSVRNESGNSESDLNMRIAVLPVAEMNSLAHDELYIGRPFSPMDINPNSRANKETFSSMAELFTVPVPPVVN